MVPGTINVFGTCKTSNFLWACSCPPTCPSEPALWFLFYLTLRSQMFWSSVVSCAASRQGLGWSWSLLQLAVLSRFVAYVDPVWLSQTLWNQVPAVCPDRLDQGKGVVLTVCLAEAEKWFPKSWQAPYRNWVALLSVLNAVFSKELSWRWTRKKDGVCSHWFLHGGRCLSAAGDPQRR